jgi:adenylate cyclase class IV
MAEELELKAVVTDPAALRAQLSAAGARPGFRGVMTDYRYDHQGALAARDEVLRVRTYRPDEGPPAAEIAWKGPATRTAEGYKRRTELTCEARPAPDGPDALLEALGYRVVHTIDRRVEVWMLAGATLRIEWYPRMDVLLEVEGAPAAIEAAVSATGLPRHAFTAEALIDFVRRYEPRAGRPAALSLRELGGDPPAWGAA